MTTKLFATGKKNKRLLVLGLLSGFIATLLVTSFYFIDNHEWYWDIAPVIGALIVILAASGGLLIGLSLAGTQERRTVAGRPRGRPGVCLDCQWHSGYSCRIPGYELPA